jgi:hypothetical protein
VVLVHDGVTFPAADQRPVDGECERPGDDEASEERQPEERVREPGLERGQWFVALTPAG